MAGSQRETTEGPALAGTWLSSRHGVDRLRLEAMARSGELLAYRAAASQELRFPAWQFNGGVAAIDALPRIRAAARRARLDDARLVEVMNMRVGLGGRERLRDLARQGRLTHVLACVAAATPRPGG